MKILIRTKYYTPGSNIFVYTGNEGPIQQFYQNSGFLNNHLPSLFDSLVVYIEHRYFGDTWPFGSKENALKKENIKYLTLQQALADYA